MSITLRTIFAWVLFCLAASNAHAQTISKVAAIRPQQAAAPTSGTTTTAPTVPANLKIVGGSNTSIDLLWDASTEKSTTAHIYYSLYQAMTSPEPDGTYSCDLSKPIDSTSSTSYTVKGLAPGDVTGLDPGKIYRFCVVATDANNPNIDTQDSDASETLEVNTARAKKRATPCWLRPTRGECMDFGLTSLDAHDKIVSNINAFYQTAGWFSFLNQVKSIYNQASGSTTVSADFATLNFGDGMQVNVQTNAQVGSSGTSAASSTAVPILSTNSAGQATQNVIYGGTFLVAESYPLLATGVTKWGSPGGFGTFVDFALKEGADVQNFKSGTNVSTTSPPFHGSAKIEGYLQYNSINLATTSQNFVGSLFAGGSYGYDYMSRGYAKDYGFGNQMSNGIGQILFGVLINGVAKITVSRAFGPSQTYIDGTTMVQKTLNNLKAWSFGITYQSAPPSK